MAKYCTNCGHELREDEKFCSECGTAVGVSDKGRAGERTADRGTTADGRIRCPNPACPQPDDVQKVSIVVQSGTIQGLQRFSSGTYSVTSGLSQQLAAPVRPLNSGRWGVSSVFWLSFFLLVIISIFVLFIEVGHGPEGPDAPPPIVLPLVLVSMVVGAVWLVLYKVNAASAFKTEYAKYLAAQAKWEQLYYCNRCGSVFNPSVLGRFVPASRMKELLH